MQKYFLSRDGQLIPIVFDSNQLDYEIEATQLDYLDILNEFKNALRRRLDGLERARLEQDRALAERQNGSASVQRNRSVQKKKEQLKGETPSPEDGTGDMGGLETSK